MTDAFTPERIAQLREILAKVEPDMISEKYIRRYPNSLRVKEWAGRPVHLQTDNGIWRHDAAGYTTFSRRHNEGWILPFESARSQIAHCWKDKKPVFVAVNTLPAALDEIEDAHCRENDLKAEIERLRAERDVARATAQKWHKAAIDNTIGEEACKQFARESVELLDSTWMRRAKDAEAELSRIKAERDEAVKAAEHKACGQGMAIAAGIICSAWDQPSMAAEILSAGDLDTVAKMREAEVDPYDVKLCRSALKEIRGRSARSFLSRMEGRK